MQETIVYGLPLCCLRRPVYLAVTLYENDMLYYSFALLTMDRDTVLLGAPHDRLGRLQPRLYIHRSARHQYTLWHLTRAAQELIAYAWLP